MFRPPWCRRDNLISLKIPLQQELLDRTNFPITHLPYRYRSDLSRHSSTSHFCFVFLNWCAKLLPETLQIQALVLVCSECHWRTAGVPKLSRTTIGTKFHTKIAHNAAIHRTNPPHQPITKRGLSNEKQRRNETRGDDLNSHEYRSNHRDTPTRMNQARTPQVSNKKRKNIDGTATAVNAADANVTLEETDFNVNNGVSTEIDSDAMDISDEVEVDTAESAVRQISRCRVRSSCTYSLLLVMQTRMQSFRNL